MWYSKVQQNLSELPNFIDYYNIELNEAKKEVKLSGLLTRNSADLPGIVEHRFNDLQEIEAVLNYLNIYLKKLKQKYYKIYLENYNRALSSRDAEKYADSEQEIIDVELLLNEVALLRNRYLGVIKGLEVKGFQINNIVKLKTAGFEDASI